MRFEITYIVNGTEDSFIAEGIQSTRYVNMLSSGSGLENKYE